MWSCFDSGMKGNEMTTLEHVNVTVRDVDATASLYEKLFDWHIRWRGDAIHGGSTIHVGNKHSYVALYQPVRQDKSADESYYTTGGLNHIGIVVEDLDAIEERVKAAGLVPHNHADYEPGRRFYFDDPDGVEIEVVSYG